MKLKALFFILFLSNNCQSKPLRDDESDKTKTTQMIRDVKFGKKTIKKIEKHLLQNPNNLYGSLFYEAICQNAWGICYTVLDFIEQEKLKKESISTVNAGYNYKIFLHDLIRSKAPDQLIEKYAKLFPESLETRDRTINSALPLEVVIMQSDNNYLAKILIPTKIKDWTKARKLAESLDRSKITELLRTKEDIEIKKTLHKMHRKRNSQGSAANTDQQSKRPNLKQQFTACLECSSGCHNIINK